jgi:hypothetical protein
MARGYELTQDRQIQPNLLTVPSQPHGTVLKAYLTIAILLHLPIHVNDYFVTD